MKNELKSLIISRLQVADRMSLNALANNRTIKDKCQGSLDYIAPMKGKTSNIVLLKGVNQYFIDAINELIKEKQVEIKPLTPSASASGSSTYNLPVAEELKAYPTPHYMSTELILTEY